MSGGWGYGLNLSSGSIAIPTNSPRPETDSPRSETDSPRSETDSPRSETDSPRSETDPPRSETDSPRSDHENLCHTPFSMQDRCLLHSLVPKPPHPLVKECLAFSTNLSISTTLP